MVILGLGSNMGDRLANLREAASRLSEILTGMRFSRIYESKALLPSGAPAEWDKPFLNMAVSGETKLASAGVFIAIKKIEREMGRQSQGNWGPRVIDIDILAIDNQIERTADLIVPHRDLLLRDFALLPLAELAPGWQYPVQGPYYGWQAEEIVKSKGYAPNAGLRDIGEKIHG